MYLVRMAVVVKRRNKVLNRIWEVVPKKKKVRKMYSRKRQQITLKAPEKNLKKRLEKIDKKTP